jgi:hypothetical protein
VRIPRTLFKFLKDELVWTAISKEYHSKPLILKHAVDAAKLIRGEVYIKIDNPEELLNEQTKDRERERS